MSSSSCCASRREALRHGAALAAALLSAGLAQAQGAEEAVRPPDWPLRGQARLRFLGLSVYDIQLQAPQPVVAARWAEQPLLLTLRYHRTLDGRAIAERSIQEMRRQGPLPDEAAWLAVLRHAFPDVQEGDRLSGLHEPEHGARFWFNGQARAARLEPPLSRRFFGIWLAPQTSEPALRRALLGLESG